MQIYFYNTLLDEDYYTKLSQSKLLFTDNDSFALGSTICTKIELGIDSEYFENLGIILDDNTPITITKGETQFGVFYIDSLTKSETEYNFVLTDKMINFNKKYNAKELIEASEKTTIVDGKEYKYVTLKEIINDICSKENIQLENTTFYGENKQITWYDSTKTARQYIGYVAELNGGYALINKQGKLEFRTFTNNPVKVIDEEECDKFEIGDHIRISRVAFENGLGTFEPVGDETFNTLYLNTENVFITAQNDLQHIYSIINDFRFYSFKVENSPIFDEVDAGDCIAFTKNGENYLTIAQYELDYNGGWLGGYKLQVKNEKQQETTIIDNVVDDIKDIKTILNRNEASIEFLSTNTYTKKEVNNIVSGDEETAEVKYVATEKGTFDKDGLRIQQVDLEGKIISETTGLFNENGVELRKVNDGQIDQGKPILFSGYVKQDNADYEAYKGQSITASQNIVVDKWAVLGQRSRIEDFTQDGIEKTGMFPLGE